MSSPSIVFRPQAAGEVRSARDRYEEQKPGPGARFVDAVDELLQRMAERPSAFPVVRDEIRRAVLRQFPYAICLRDASESIVVIAVMHSHRHPRRWQSRL